MSTFRPETAREAESAVRAREARLASGLVLGFFLLTHFSNHALGLISVEAMEGGRQWFSLLWRNPIGTVLLYGALTLHFALALQALYRRRTLRMPFKEAAQLVLGLSLPFLLVAHVVGTRVEFSLTGRELGYPDVVRNLWLLAPENGVKQAVALVVAWVHGCFGIYFWLRARSWFPQAAPYLFTVALLVPMLGLLGFAEAGKAIADDPERYSYTAGALSSEGLLSDIRTILYATFAGLIGAVFAARGVRAYVNLSNRVRITYPGGHVVMVPRGFSVLEASRLAGIPHLSACGGRGRCSTCRVRVIEGLADQPEPTQQERATLARIKAGGDVRLACQLRPVQDLSVVPVLSASRIGLVAPAGGNRMAGRGRERELAVLFCDLRGFTRLSERRLPFDTVFILNRYFDVVGHAIEDAGGYLDKFIGDGALALFGLETTSEEAARQAFTAALRIIDGVKSLSEAYASELEQPLQVVVSLHAGPAVVGEMGYGHAMGLTAVGDTINAASRLEGLAKERNAPLVISSVLAKRAGLDLSGYEQQTVTVRGRAAPIDAWIVADGESLKRDNPVVPSGDERPTS
ncbi:adenylate/guanylate cyclase domain-containing protein [Microvirga flavescens]|uniref:adenylate/guanylate cyclase domain-containing protein n=1 Tax=Microvirga flavescens TaxID=2249811 RepID=UPI000DD520AD|nr:adenylate/guanylate cyclase domain-containing protein [Microvirga flavescens]